MLKKRKVKMLPTSDKSGTLWLTPNGALLHTHVSGEFKDKCKPQHLYITSDEDVKEGDWSIYNWLDDEGKDNWKVGQIVNVNHVLMYLCNDFTSRSGYMPLSTGIKKIIATTDISIKFLAKSMVEKMNRSGYYRFDFPQPSEGFIRVFVEEYNKGNIIEDVLVEYDHKLVTIEDFEDQIPVTRSQEQIFLKVDKNNNITIKKIKDTFTRADIIHAFTSGHSMGKQGTGHGPALEEYKERENL